MRAPRALLWDVGNVIVGWSPRRLYEKLFEEPAACDRFLSSVCTLDWHIEHDRGVSFADNAAALITRHPEHEAHIRAWGDRFLDMVGPVIAETEDAMHALAARGVPQYGLTNMPSEAWPAVRALSPAFALLADTIVSGDERLVKPDPALYAVVLARTGLEPADLLFVDDSAANIDAARALGFHVHRFEDPAALWPTLIGHGLLEAGAAEG
ncbi:MAG: HAD family phosphatase [Caulobacter sp.]|nr:HAD family phosphatase [Caulobacter sp.]